MPKFGEVSTEYPRGYGFCACGCGLPTRLDGRGRYFSYIRGHNPEAQTRDRTDNTLSSNRRQLVKAPLAAASNDSLIGAVHESPKSRERTDDDSAALSKLIQEQGNLKKLIEAMKLLQAYNPHMEMQQALTALYAFSLDDDARTPKTIREIMDIHSSTCSRNLAAISNIGIRDKPGYDWIRLAEDPNNRTRKLITLTRKGALVRKMLVEIMRG